MSKRKNKRTNKKIVNTIASLILLVILAIASQNENFQKYFEIDINSQNQQATENEIKSTSVSSENGIKNIVIGSGDINNENNLHVYYI